MLTKDEARIVALGKSSEIAAACEALDADATATRTPTARARARCATSSSSRSGSAKETKRLLVSPEGPLSYVPFAALVPDLDVAYEPSGTTYGVLLEEKDKHGEQVLALGDPDYTAKFDPIALDLYAPVAVARAGATRGGRLAPLPGTREEAMAVADVTLLGKDASEAGLRAALAKKKGRWRAVHFACHGLVNPDRPTLSSLALTPEAEDDGFLTALEVLKMEIPSDLVVLSACETGKGKIVGRRGDRGPDARVHVRGQPAGDLLALEGGRRGDAGADDEVLRAVEPEGRQARAPDRRGAAQGAGVRASRRRSGSTRTTGPRGCCGGCPRRRRRRSSFYGPTPRSVGRVRGDTRGRCRSVGPP